MPLLEACCQVHQRQRQIRVGRKGWQDGARDRDRAINNTACFKGCCSPIPPGSSACVAAPSFPLLSLGSATSFTPSCISSASRQQKWSSSGSSHAPSRLGSRTSCRDSTAAGIATRATGREQGKLSCPILSFLMQKAAVAMVPQLAAPHTCCNVQTLPPVRYPDRPATSHFTPLTWRCSCNEKAAIVMFACRQQRTTMRLSATGHTRFQMCSHLAAASRKATPTMRCPSLEPSHTAASSGTSAAAAAAADRPASPAAAAAVPRKSASSNAERRPGDACLNSRRQESRQRDVTTLLCAVPVCAMLYFWAQTRGSVLWLLHAAAIADSRVQRDTNNNFGHDVCACVAAGTNLCTHSTAWSPSGVTGPNQCVGIVMLC